MIAHLLYDQEGWKVHAIVRKNSLNLPLLEHLRSLSSGRLALHYGDVTDTFFVFSLIKLVAPDHIYNFAAQSHVGHSFVNPMVTYETNTKGLMIICESLLKLSKVDCKVFHASTSEMYGDQPIPVSDFSESSPF